MELKFSYRVATPLLDPRIIKTDVKLVPSEEAILHTVVELCEEREPGQADYPLQKASRLVWLDDAGIIRDRWFYGLTMGETFELMGRLSQAGEFRCSRYCEGENEPNMVRKLSAKADRFDREIAKEGGV